LICKFPFLVFFLAAQRPEKTPIENISEGKMKILVIGAGVLGSLYAARLQIAGNEVTLLGRGQRLAELRQHGIVLEEYGSGQQVATPVTVIDKLNPEDAYELALVLVRKNQLDEVLEMLAINPCIPSILFMFNNAAGPGEMIRAVGRERVLLGFPGGGGMRQGHVVHYLQSPRSAQPTTIGELEGGQTKRLMTIAATFEAAGLPVVICEAMDAWLKTHVALISPLANAIYAAGGDRLRLARSRDALVLLVRSIREGLRVLEALGVPITPGRYRVLAWLPEPLLVGILQRSVTSERFEVAAVRHAMAARDELEHLAGEFRFLARVVSASTPSMDYLAAFINPQNPPMPEGKSDLALEWGGLWRLLAVVAVIVGIIGWLRRK
jgi:2-dehydropantoate 2-reductase